MKFPEYLHTMRGYLLLMALLCVGSAQDYQLDVILRSYRNSENQIHTGQCCDNVGQHPCTLFSCTSSCDPFFEMMTSDESTPHHVTPVYRDTGFVMFPEHVYTFLGNDSLWPGTTFNLNVIVKDYDGQDNFGSVTVEYVTNFLFLINKTETQNCTFLNKSMAYSTGPVCHEHGYYIELNISYRLVAETTNANAPSSCQSTETCLDIDYCSPRNPCGNNGTCLNEGDDGYRCECGEGYSGTHCEQTDFCVVHSPCQNGGNCTMSSETLWYTCSCPDEWQGLNCDVSISHVSATVVLKNSRASCATHMQTPHRPLSGSIPLPTGQLTEPRMTPSGEHSTAVFYGGVAGSFVAGFSLAGILCVCITVCLTARRARKYNTQFTRKAYNPFYQSVEDLVDGCSGNDSTKNLYNSANGHTPGDDGYEMLKTHQRSSVNCNGKLKPLHKRESGYMYCLSPTDPPVPLRAVPKGNSRLQHDSLRFHSQHRPNKLQLGHRAGTRDVSTSGSASLKSAGSCGGNFSAPSKGPCSPIYEVLELPGRASSIRASAVPVASEDAPTLPRRGPLRRANNVKPNPNGVSESQTMPQNARSKSISGSIELDVETERNQEDTECVARGEEEGEQSEMASWAKMEREQKRQSKLQDEDKNIPSDDLDAPLYSKVKKPKKCGAIVMQNSRAAEKERLGKVQLEGDLLGPPSVPPYSEGDRDCSFTVEESKKGAENDIITRMKHDDRGSGDQTSIPLYSVVKKNKEIATKVCDSPM